MVYLSVRKNPIIPDSWYQGYITINGSEYKLGQNSIEKEDCIREMEQIVKNFSLEKIQVEHGLIYCDLLSHT